MNTSNHEKFSTLDWGRVDLSRVPHLPVPPPGKLSNEWHARCTKHFKGLSGQVKLFPVSFESGAGCVLRDVDGNEYIDFSSGIYVTTLLRLAHQPEHWREVAAILGKHADDAQP